MSDELIERAEKASKAIFIAVDESVAKDVSEIITDLVSRLKSQDGVVISRDDLTFSAEVMDECVSVYSSELPSDYVHNLKRVSKNFRAALSTQQESEE